MSPNNKQMIATSLSSLDADSMLCATIENFCGIPAYVWDLALKPHQQTRHYIWPIKVMAMILFPAVCYLTAFFRAEKDAISSIVMFVIFQLACIAHGIRHAYLMKHIPKENHSELPGKTWPLFNFVGDEKSYAHAAQKYFRIHVVCEPLIALATSVALGFFHVVNPFMAVYLFFAGYALFLKNATHAYRSWLQRRKLADQEYELKMRQDMINGMNEASEAHRNKAAAAADEFFIAR